MWEDLPASKLGIRDDLPKRSVDYLTDCISNADDMLKASKQAADLEKVGQASLAGRIRQRISQASAELYGRNVDKREMACISLAERLKETGWNFEKRDDLGQAEKTYKAVVEIYQKELGESVPTANALADSARVSNEQGKLLQSRVLFVKAVQIYDKHPTSCDAQAASALEYYANLLDKQRCPVLAATMFKRAVAVRKRAYSKR